MEEVLHTEKYYVLTDYIHSGFLAEDRSFTADVSKAKRFATFNEAYSYADKSCLYDTRYPLFLSREVKVIKNAHF